MRVCLTCEEPITGHFNRKRCGPCAKALVHKPAAHLTERQQKMVLKYAGRIYQEDLAEKIGSSRTNLIRWAGRHGISLNCFSYKPDIVRAVSGFYELHGLAKTQKAFPKVSVRSIVERRGRKLFAPRQTKWTGAELIELARMGGLVSELAQAKYFNRPRAYAGSVHSVWNKRFGFMGGSINGMSHNQAKHLVNCKARYIETKYGSGDVNNRRICLWVTMEANLKRGVPPFIGDAVKTMAQFQRWLHKSDDPAKVIKRMIRNREI